MQTTPFRKQLEDASLERIISDKEYDSNGHTEFAQNPQPT